MSIDVCMSIYVRVEKLEHKKNIKHANEKNLLFL